MNFFSFGVVLIWAEGRHEMIHKVRLGGEAARRICGGFNAVVAGGKLGNGAARKSKWVAIVRRCLRLLLFLGGVLSAVAAVTIVVALFAVGVERGSREQCSSVL
jgi:hypothetical protein